MAEEKKESPTKEGAKKPEDNIEEKKTTKKATAKKAANKADDKDKNKEGATEPLGNGIVKLEALEKLTSTLKPENIDAEATELLCSAAENFIVGAIQFSSRIVQHRGGSTIEENDVARYLRTNWNLNIYSDAEDKGLPNTRKRSTSALYSSTQDLVKKYHNKKS